MPCLSLEWINWPLSRDLLVEVSRNLVTPNHHCTSDSRALLAALFSISPSAPLVKEECLALMIPSAAHHHHYRILCSLHIVKAYSLWMIRL